MSIKIVFTVCSYAERAIVIKAIDIMKLPKIITDMGYKYDYVSHLDCSGCGGLLTQLPPLPLYLNYLHCGGNQLTELPELPRFLNYLYCNNNRLTKLPELTPHLCVLDCHSNLLTKLPASPMYKLNDFCMDVSDNPIPPLH